LLLPVADEDAASAAVKAAISAKSGWYDPVTFPDSHTITDLAWVGAARLRRDGDWIEFAHDDRGESKWSHQADAFYLALAPFVREGRIEFEGEDGERWSFTFAGGELTQHPAPAADSDDVSDGPGGG
jgi:hypothetical protein